MTRRWLAIWSAMGIGVAGASGVVLAGSGSQVPQQVPKIPIESAVPEMESLLSPKGECKADTDCTTKGEICDFNVPYSQCVPQCVDSDTIYTAPVVSVQAADPSLKTAGHITFYGDPNYAAAGQQPRQSTVQFDECKSKKFVIERHCAPMTKNVWGAGVAGATTTQICPVNTECQLVSVPGSTDKAGACVPVASKKPDEPKQCDPLTDPCCIDGAKVGNDLCPEIGCQLLQSECQQDLCPDVLGIQTSYPYTDADGNGLCNQIPPAACQDPDPKASYPNATVICLTASGQETPWSQSCAGQLHLDTCATATDVMHWTCTAAGLVTDLTHCPPGMTCKNGLCGGGANPPLCFDSDAANSPYKKGYVEGKPLASAQKFHVLDYCKDIATVMEHSCAPTEPSGYKPIPMLCGTGEVCSGGVCIPNTPGPPPKKLVCGESDAGKDDPHQVDWKALTDPDTGEIVKTEFDHCLADLSKIVETSCGGDITMFCPPGEICKGGKCVPGEIYCSCDDAGSAFVTVTTVDSGESSKQNFYDACVGEQTVKLANCAPAQSDCYEFIMIGCAPSEKCEYAQCVPQCTDSDVGNDPFALGSVVMPGGLSHTDYCEKDTLHQVNCPADPKATTPDVTKMTCPFGCANGVCKPDPGCVDDEPANDPYVAGTVTWNGKTYPDYCITASTPMVVQQPACTEEPGGVLIEGTLCPYGCKDGACQKDQCLGLTIDDGDPCTKDTCDSKTGKVEHVKQSVAPDGSSCAVEECKDELEVLGLTAGDSHVCALMNDAVDQGSVWCWGRNDGDAKTVGPLGVTEGVIWGSAIPLKVLGVTGAISLDAGDDHNCVVMNGGNTVSCWGGIWGDKGFDLADLPADLYASPKEFLSSVLQVSVSPISVLVKYCSGHACVRTQKDGAVWCWGNNIHGQLGASDLASKPDCSDYWFPLKVTKVGKLSAIDTSAGGFFSCAVNADGLPVCWGGEFPIPVDPYSQSFLPDLAGLYGLTQVSTGHNHACAVSTEGNAYCWILGDNTKDSQWKLGGVVQPGKGYAQVILPEGVKAKRVEPGRFHSCLISTTGDVWCWGASKYGQLGAAEIGGMVTTPIKVPGIANVAHIAVGDFFTCAADTSQQVWCWGLKGKLFDYEIGWAYDPYGEPIPQAFSPVPELVKFCPDKE